jgi:hypothetical protein
LFYICVLCFVSWNCCLLSCLYFISCLLVMLNLPNRRLRFVLFFCIACVFLIFHVVSIFVNLGCCNYVVIQIAVLMFSFHCVFPKEVFQICIWLFCRIVFYVSIFGVWVIQTMLSSVCLHWSSWCFQEVCKIWYFECTEMMLYVSLFV